MSTKESEVQNLLHAEPLKKVEGPIIAIKMDDPGIAITVNEAKIATINKPIVIETLVPDKTSLENIVATQKQISQVKASLGTIIDTMAQNPSLFTRAATYFGEIPLWQKITLGLGLSVPTLAAGIFAHVGVLLVIGGVTVVAYTGMGIVLDDHHHCNINIAERLKSGIFNLADVLQLTIDALDTIRTKLAAEIEKFKTENLKLAEHVAELGDQIDLLSAQVELYIETEKLLRETKVALEETAAKLNASTSEQTELLKQNQDELSRITKAYSKSQEQLTDKIGELTTVRVSMGLEVEKAKKVAATLQGTVSTLSGTVIDDVKQRQAFQEKLTVFLADKESSFDTIAERICMAERELTRVKDELKNSNERYNELLARQEKQIARLEALDNKITPEPMKSKDHVAELLNINGIYAKKPAPEVSSRQREDLALEIK